MKKRIYFFIAILSLLVMSCKKYLDRTDLSHLTVDDYFKTEADIDAFVNGLYTAMVPGWDSPNLDFATDLNALNPARGDFANTDISLGTFSPTSSSIAQFWGYGAIRNAYVYFDQVKNVQMSNDKLNLYNGSMNYLLAYRYFVMFRAYESVPVVNKVLTPDEADKIPASSKDDVFSEALKKVNEAIQQLPSLGPTERVRGRLTKLSAMVLKTDMLLYAASRFNGAIAGATWQAAADAAAAAIAEADGKGYGLAGSYINLFTGAHQTEADIQKEIILEQVRLPKIATNSVSNYDWSPRVTGFGIATYMATQELVDMYECTDGKPINKSSLYDPSRPFKYRDSRLSVSVLSPGTIANTIDPSKNWLFNSLDPSPANNDYILSSYNPRNQSVSGYINIKYWDKDLGTQTMGMGYTSFVVYRYAELLLMYAEAKNEASGPDITVYNALSKVRQRSGMPMVNATSHPSKEDVRALIRNERVVELQGEGKRYWDVRRWGIGEQVQNKPFKSMHISKFNADGSFNSYMDKIWVGTSLTDPGQEASFVIPDGSTGGRLMTTGVFIAPKFYVWPIPQSVITSSTSGILKQNPLWQ